MIILFIDDRIVEVMRQWQSANVLNHEAYFHHFDTIDGTIDQVRSANPDVVVIGFGLGFAKPTGAEVAIALRVQGYKGLIVANSGGEDCQFTNSGIVPDYSTRRRAELLRQFIEER